MSVSVSLCVCNCEPKVRMVTIFDLPDGVNPLYMFSYSGLVRNSITEGRDDINAESELINMSRYTRRNGGNWQTHVHIGTRPTITHQLFLEWHVSSSQQTAKIQLVYCDCVKHQSFASPLCILFQVMSVFGSYHHLVINVFSLETMRQWVYISVMPKEPIKQRFVWL